MQESALDYALYLCHGHSAGLKVTTSSSLQQDGEKQMVVLDETGIWNLHHPLSLVSGKI